MAAPATSSSSAPVNSDKPVIVRVKRKTYQSPLEAFWLEINERPLKRPLLDFEKLSINESSSKVVELKPKKLFVQHVDTVCNSDVAVDILQSFVASKPKSANGVDTKAKLEDQRRSNKTDDKQKQLLVKAKETQEILGKNARFKQIWKSRKGKDAAESDDALRDMYHLYVELIDAAETSVVQEEEETSTPFTINDISEQPGPSNLSAFVVSETTDWSRTDTNRRKSRAQGNTLSTGRGLLSVIPTVATILPRMQDCPHCGAIKFYSETKKFCCLNGRVVLKSNELPDILKDMLTSTSEEAKTFRTYIRTYNNLFAFTSLGVRCDANLSKRNNGVYTFRVQGQVYHFINDLVPKEGNAKNLQLYFHDTEHELENRLASCERLSKQLTELCMKALEDNPYACFFRTLKDVPQLENYKIILKTLPSQDQRRYNKPEVSQVAAVWVDGKENGEQSQRDIEVKTHSNQSRKIAY